MTRLHTALAALALLALAPAAAIAAPELSVLKQIPGPDGRWDYASFDPAHRRVYIGRGDGVTALDVDTGVVTPKLLSANRTHIALPVAGGDEILVTVGGDGTAVIANALTGTIRATIKTGKKPDGAFLEPTTGLAWVLDNAGGGVSLIDVKSGVSVGAIPVPGALESAATDGKGLVYINAEDLAAIEKVDVASRKVIGEIKLAGCDEPSGLAFDPESRRLVTVCANGVALVVDAVTGKPLARLPIGPRPDTALYDPARKLVYVPTGGDGMLTLIDPAAAKVVGVVPTKTGARSQALDPKTGILYLPAATFAPSTTPGERPGAAAGSFVILAVGTK